MIQAQEVRAGNVIMVGKDPMVVQRAEYNKGGRNAAVMKMKLRNLLTGGALGPNGLAQSFTLGSTYLIHWCPVEI